MSEPLPHLDASLKYAQVAVQRPLTQTFSYRVAASMMETIRVGSIVEVPFGRTKVQGVVVDLLSKVELPDKRLRTIERILTPDYHIHSELLSLARWISEYYCCAWGEALGAVSMIGFNDLSPRHETVYTLAHADHWLAIERNTGPDGKPTTEKHRKVIHTLLAIDGVPHTLKQLQELCEVGPGVLQTMIKHGWLVGTQREVAAREGIRRQKDKPTPAHALTLYQQGVFAELSTMLESNAFHAALLHGVTGSGKTEIYLQVIEKALRAGRNAIVLVPEISLTPQVIRAFEQRLGALVGVYHSRQTLDEKYRLCRAIEAGEVRVVIGARSALFAPLPSLGVIIVDEEHESSYKQGQTPRYHARDVAVMRAKRLDALVILGSATPSIESWHNAREGKYRLLSLPERVGPHAPAQMTIVDMKRYAKVGKLDGADEGILSPPLREAMARRLEAGEQTVLLLNRRGFANQVVCLKCEHQIMCERCDVPMTYHKSRGDMLCHWCGHHRPLPTTCPACHAAEIQTLGIGTQRIEEVLAASFPTARVLRVDMDSMRRKGAFEEAWEKIQNHEVDIILGTQMIAKGLHIESVTLVGVISADFALFLPDFRSAERTYALLTQVGGRAGRGEKPGEIIIQSYMPHHYAIDCAARLEEKNFYQRELHQRNIMRFPPFSRLVAIVVNGGDLGAVRTAAERLAGLLKTLVHRAAYHDVQVLGPLPAPIARLEEQHRWRLLIRGRHAGRLHQLLHEALKAFESGHKKSNVAITIDVDPFDFM